MQKNFFRKVLKNGMTVILEKRDLPIVSVAFAVRSGARDEKEEEKGISHFIEHMMYKGTPTRNQFKIAEEIEKNGGELNGFTSESIVAYWCKMPSDKKDIALEVLSDMIKNPLFKEEDLEKERKVIFEELKMYVDSPRRHVLDKVKEELFSKPFGINIIGTFETMNSIDRAKLVKYFKNIYTPNNMVFAAVGDMDFKEMVEFAENNFGDEKSEIKGPLIEKENNSNIEKRKGIDQANLVYAYHVPTAGNKKNYAAQVLSTLMAGGMSSRLFAEIRNKRNLAYVIRGDSDIDKDFAYNFIFAGVKKENVGEVEEVIKEEFEKVSEELEEKELNEVKEQMIGNYKIGMEESQGQLINLLVSEILSDATEFYNYEKNILDVKLGDIKKLAAGASKDYSFFALVPEDK